MIVSSFYEKAELEQFLKNEISTCDYAHCISACWEPLLEAELSVVLEDGEYEINKKNFLQRTITLWNCFKGISELLRIRDHHEKIVHSLKG